MSIGIDNNLCVGCKKCVDVCPGNLIYSDEGNKAYIKYPKDCWGCTACIKECNSKAIKYFLPKEVGGAGSFLYTKNNKDNIEWHIVDTEKKEKLIITYKNESNKY